MFKVETTQILLEVEELTVEFPGVGTKDKVIGGISFALQKGEVVGLVGESGSGKSLTGLSIIGLLPVTARITNGNIIYHQSNSSLSLLDASVRWNKIRGAEIAMIFQEPMTALNPIMSCGSQISEVLQQHHGISVDAAKQEVLKFFEKVHIKDPGRVYDSYPHQLSGGQRQRIVIAMALCCNPSLLIADEPTSSLDVTVQRSILEIFKELKAGWGGTILFISHDLQAVAEIADRVLIMQNGTIVEQGSIDDVFRNPQHPYTQELINSIPKGERSLRNISEDARPLLAAKKLSTWFPVNQSFLVKSKRIVKAIQEIDIEVFEGETLGIVGESGSGKTTLGKSLLLLEKPSNGNVTYKSVPIAHLDKGEWKALRKDLQIIFQDPYSSLNPLIPVGEAIAEPMKYHGIAKNRALRIQKVLDLLQLVGLDESHFGRFPNELSGGQRQRICIARALALEPKLIICDECVSALDVSVQRQILDLLISLQEKFCLTYIFISHDLQVIRYLCNRVVVMSEGKIVETGQIDEICNTPKHPYTKKLLQSAFGNENKIFQPNH
jgi:peptide/nickel transport system ATP-binding protein